MECIEFRFKFDVDKTSRRTFTQGFLKYDTQAQLKNRHYLCEISEVLSEANSCYLLNTVN